jgi:hypothetical protein
MIKFDKDILYQTLCMLSPDDESTPATGKIWFGKLGDHYIVSLRVPSNLGEIRNTIKSSGQAVEMYDITGASNPVLPQGRIGLERFKQLIQRDGFGDILWNEQQDYSFVTIYLIDPVLIKAFSQSKIDLGEMVNTN